MGRGSCWRKEGSARGRVMELLGGGTYFGCLGGNFACAPLLPFPLALKMPSCPGVTQVRPQCGGPQPFPPQFCD